MISTLKQISEAAGTSVSTASLILNGRQGHRFSPSTRDAVTRAARKLGYRPQRAAQALVTGKTKNIALIVNGLANPFFGQYASLLHACLMERGYTVVPFEIQSDLPERKVSSLQWIDQRAIDAAIDLQGALGFGPSAVETYRQFIQHRPLVFRDVEDRPQLHGHDRVIVDYEVGTRRLFDHLASTGRRRLGVVTVRGHVPGRADELGRPIEDSRYVVALRQWIADAGLICPDSAYRAANDERITSGDWCRAAHDLLRDQPQIEALLVHNLEALPAVLHGVDLAGRKIGRDLAVATFDDLPLARWLGPGITVVGEPAKQVAAHLAELTLDRLADPKAPSRRLTVPSQLYVRGSTDPNWSAMRDEARDDVPADPTTTPQGPTSGPRTA